MIDLVYRTVQVIINKENRGYVSPSEFNLLANKVQQEIFESYFYKENKEKLKEDKGYSHKGYSNLDYNIRQKITQFSEKINIDKDVVNQRYNLPNDLYLIEDDGVTSEYGAVIEEVERTKINYLLKSESKPSINYPIYESYGKYIYVYPNEIEKIKLRYIRVPKQVNWTYVLINDAPMFNPSSSTYQDFEIHSSEFSNLVVGILELFGINLRDIDVYKIAEQLKQTKENKEN